VWFWHNIRQHNPQRVNLKMDLNLTAAAAAPHLLLFGCVDLANVVNRQSMANLLGPICCMPMLKTTNQTWQHYPKT